MADEKNQTQRAPAAAPTNTAVADGAGPASNAAARNPRAAVSADDALRSRQEEARQAAARKIDQESKARHEANVEADQRRSQSKPTPTQRENDLAKLGALDHDSKEDDGSGPDMATVTRREVVSNDDPAKYKTRDVTK
jgi:hypothetical protein